MRLEIYVKNEHGFYETFTDPESAAERIVEVYGEERLNEINEELKRESEAIFDPLFAVYPDMLSRFNSYGGGAVIMNNDADQYKREYVLSCFGENTSKN